MQTHPTGIVIRFSATKPWDPPGLIICGNIITIDIPAASDVDWYTLSIFAVENGLRVYRLTHPVTNAAAQIAAQSARRLET